MILTVVLFEKEVAIKWASKEESFIPLNVLRSACPCAFCSGERDVFGNKYIGQPKGLGDNAFTLVKFEKIGLYGLRFFWKDGHKDGIYTFELLKSLK